MDFLREVIPKLNLYYRWLASARDPDKDGLISIIAQFESRLDFSPAYDSVIGVKNAPFRQLGRKARIPEIKNKLLLGCDLKRFSFTNHHQEDVLVNSIYAQGLRSLANIAKAVGETEIQKWAWRQSEIVLKALVAKCYDEKRSFLESCWQK